MSKQDFKWLILTSLALISALFSIPLLGQGGSLNLAYLFFFLIIINYPKKQFLYTVVLYTVFMLIFARFFITPLQWILDYPLAILSLMTGTLFIKHQRKYYRIVIIISLGMFLSYLMHCISGYIFFSQYAPANTNALLYTLSYNLIYMLPNYAFLLIIFKVFNKNGLLYNH